MSACIDPWVKNHIARFQIGKPVHEISEYEWIEHFNACKEAESYDLSLLDAKMMNLKLNVNLGDATSMMSQLSMKIYKISDSLGLTSYVEKNDPKRMVKYVIDALEPPAFKARIECYLKMDSHKEF